MLTVLTRPLCAMCAVVMHWLDEAKVAYREVDVTSEPRARRFLRRITGGDVSVPAVVLGDGRVLVEPGRSTLLLALGEGGR